MSLVRIRPYRCRDCGTRFYRYSRHSHRRSERAVLPPAFGAREKPAGGRAQIVEEIKLAENRLEGTEGPDSLAKGIPTR
ncbi:MAG: hypothetical protein EHM18_15955 [Acidobacteria bacterium]|nr:MAG: hypothetical protein EHM18_15955 [Acidobacteriota bacterium]